MDWQPQFNPPQGFCFPEKGTTFTVEQQRLRGDYAELLFWQIGPICRERGYTLARHGSGIRDVDFVAVPWEPDAIPAAELILEIAVKFNLTMVSKFNMPHGMKWFCMIGPAFPTQPIEIAVCPTCSAKI